MYPECSSPVSYRVARTFFAEGTHPIYVLFGSNKGTCEALAQRIVADAGGQGFKANSGELDTAAGHLLTDGPVIIVTASYEENATRFVEWLASLRGDAPTGIALAGYGAIRLLPRGEANAGSSDFLEAFTRWEEAL
ncbi:uncharacterized protein PHACADRAFT_201107 [Phanerochaete carnosa HHB-10118-sp]|uniref:Flavodoxin-like domain-containing protein n=1 Tax=Phanerochaete carnosa (strain HHB-10118-sp) TaxID=650164 RepID=K5VUK1_PHACS|nr:uncharacterized protein PHACADRAFT_201107 [Phanerochaete carnosa HHB-10118-sp]EKM50264.1 hypothetical protein PHACADRAFT_201107 [Phanerochaete carnosa HHB-10118-sp]